MPSENRWALHLQFGSIQRSFWPNIELDFPSRLKTGRKSKDALPLDLGLGNPEYRYQ